MCPLVTMGIENANDSIDYTFIVKVLKKLAFEKSSFSGLFVHYQPRKRYTIFSFRNGKGGKAT